MNELRVLRPLTGPRMVEDIFEKRSLVEAFWADYDGHPCELLALPDVLEYGADRIWTFVLLTSLSTCGVDERALIFGVRRVGH